MAEPTEDTSGYSPLLAQMMKIDPEKIGLLIGPGGKTIRRIVETTGAQIDIADDDSGKVFIYSNNADAMNRAVQEIDALCGGGSQIEMGKLYQGRVTGTKEFGAFVGLDRAAFEHAEDAVALAGERGIGNRGHRPRRVRSGLTPKAPEQRVRDEGGEAGPERVGGDAGAREGFGFDEGLQDRRDLERAHLDMGHARTPRCFP